MKDVVMDALREAEGRIQSYYPGWYDVRMYSILRRSIAIVLLCRKLGLGRGEVEVLLEGIEDGC